MRYYFFLFFIFFNCNNKTYLPKPDAYLRLDYADKNYKNFSESNFPFEFDLNHNEVFINQKTIKNKIQINYYRSKANLNLQYFDLKNNKELLFKQLSAFNSIISIHINQSGLQPSFKEYTSLQDDIFSLLIDVKGNVSSPLHFHITDSINHLITGSLYFNQKPNYDSILPSKEYIKNDIFHLIETLRWKK